MSSTIIKKKRKEKKKKKKKKKKKGRGFSTQQLDRRIMESTKIQTYLMKLFGKVPNMATRILTAF
jgi:ribosomal protein L13E